MLSAEDRTFFALVSDATFANPFSDSRARLDQALGAARALVPAKRGDVARDLTVVVSQRLGRLRLKDLGRYPDDERLLLEHAVLFELFHRTTSRLDAFIDEQRAAGDRSLRVPFAREVAGELTGRGFTDAEALRYLALFFQLRRAFLFIDESLPGESRSMQRFRERLWQNLFTHDTRLYARSLWRRMEDFSTFLVGETGTGKGTAAAAIGRAAFIPYDPKTECFAASFEKGFVSINLSQFPETLVESELFGHTRGAFTGATTAHEGVFSRCSAHGAIFLDEIGEASVPLQIKLLRVLQERSFTPVGGHDALRFSGRVVAATNRTLHELRAGGFREDFYYRLCSDVIVVPTLRERLQEAPGELAGLVRVILARMLGARADAADADAAPGEGAPPLAATVLRTLERDVGMAYPWPGNVRELEQCIRRILLTGTYEPDRSGTPDRREAALLDVVGEDTLKELTARYCRALYARYGSYEEVARRAALDRRTVKAYVHDRAEAGRRRGSGG